MKTEKLIEQLELYSNAIVGFLVAQSIAFSFSYGKEGEFACEIGRYKILAGALLAHFVLCTVLAAGALRYLARKISELSEQHRDVLAVVFRVKVGVVVLFALIPIGLLASFGLYGDVERGRCKAPEQAAHALVQTPGSAT